MKNNNLISCDLTSKNSKLYLLVTLSAMTAFAPLVTDMYLPSLPALTGYFGTSASMVQLTISTSMLGIAIGQLFFGPISDKTGRRRPLFASFGLYLLATVGCIFSPTIYLLVGFRLLQGLGAAGSIVLARSVAADLFSGKELLKFLALIAAVQGIAPIAAPVVGGLLMLFTDWKGIFVALGLLGLAVWIVSLYMKESLSHYKRIKVPVISTLTIGNILAARLKDPHKTLRLSVAGLFIFSLLTGVSLFLDAPIACFCTVLFLTLLFAGGTFPISTNLALDLEKRYKGTASAVLGASTFLVGGIIMPLAGLGNILHSTAFAMAGSAVIALVLLISINAVQRKILR